MKVNPREFVFICAHSPEEATRFYVETYQHQPMNCHEYPLDFEVVRGNGVVSFREMRKEFVGFPVVGGVFRR